MARGEQIGGSRFVVETCYQCKVEFGLPRALYEVALQAREKVIFYCPYGHQQHYVTGQTEAEKLRQERDRLTQRLAEKDDYIGMLEEARVAAVKRTAVEKGKVTRLKNRTAAGICPCCNRHFTALERHIHTKHPEFKKEEADA